MKLEGFTGIEKSFTIIDNDVEIEVDYCDYTVNNHGVKIHEIESDYNGCMFTLEEIMNDYVDWDVIIQNALDNHNQSEEDSKMDY